MNSRELEDIMNFLSNSQSGHKIIKKMKSYNKLFYNNFFFGKFLFQVYIEQKLKQPVFLTDAVTFTCIFIEKSTFFQINANLKSFSYNKRFFIRNYCFLIFLLFKNEKIFSPTQNKSKMYRNKQKKIINSTNRK